MIELTGAQLRLIRENVSRCLVPIPRGRTTPVCIEGGTSGLVVRAKGDHAAIEWRQPGEFADQRLVIVLDVLKRLPHGRSQIISLENAGETSVLARWTEKQIPQTVECCGGEFSDNFPSLPERFVENEPSLLTAMWDAGEIVDPGNNRYALECLRLRASDGQIGATDGRQALVQCGFNFPWDGDLLVRPNRAIAGDAFAAEQIVRIGKSADWVTLQCGDWIIHLAIVKDARFPDVDRVLPEAGSEVASLELTNEDADFFVEAADKLPASKEAFSPLTIDLNGHVALCAREPATNRGAALVLSNSHRAGEELRFHTNRRYLQRAARLGFRNICFPGAEGVAWGRDDRRTYCWMSLAKELAIKPEDCVERIISPVYAPTGIIAQAAPAPTNSTCGERIVENSVRAAAREKPRAPATPDPSITAPEPNRKTALVNQVDSLRSTLAQALNQARELATALRRRQKQTRLVETTLASLRQLKEVEV